MSVAEEFQKYMNSLARDTLSVSVLGPGSFPAPRLCAKITKPIYSFSRGLGYMNSAFIDDLFLMGDSIPDPRRNVTDTTMVVRSARFVIHPESCSLMVLSFPEEPHGPLFYRLLDNEKTLAPTKHAKLAVGKAVAE